MSSRNVNTISVVAASAVLATMGVASYLFLHKKRKHKYRIVSLCPSTTRTLYDLGLADQIVGRTRYCETPNGGGLCIEKVGGTKDPNWEKIRRLQPTHILFNMEENDYTQLSLAEEICKTVVHTPVNIEESKAMVLDLGRLFGATNKAEIIVMDIDKAFQHLISCKQSNSFTFLYFIWHIPHQRVAGAGTYIEAMLMASGGTNLAQLISNERYPLVPSSFDHKADYCLLSTEPFPFNEKHVPMYQNFGKCTRIVDGELLSWHGSRTADGLRYLAKVFHGTQA